MVIKEPDSAEVLSQEEADALALSEEAVFSVDDEKSTKH